MSNYFKNCTGICKTGKHPCNCDFMPGQKTFLSNTDREIHEKKFQRGETNWKYPFEPWVVESWKRYSDANNLKNIADSVKLGMANTLKKLTANIKKNEK